MSHAVVMVAQKYIKAVEEAQEIQDRRGGKQPKTDHDPIDFLDPSTFPSSDSEDADSDESPSPKVDLRPAPLTEETAEHVAPNEALSFLQAAARGDIDALSTVGLYPTIAPKRFPNGPHGPQHSGSYRLPHCNGGNSRASPVACTMMTIKNLA